MTGGTVALSVVSLSHYLQPSSAAANIYHGMKMTILTKVSYRDDAVRKIPMETPNAINNQEKEQSWRCHTGAQYDTVLQPGPVTGKGMPIKGTEKRTHAEINPHS